MLRTRDFFPGFRILIFTHPKTARGEKKICCMNFTKLEIILLLKRQKSWANCQRIIELFTQKNVTKLSKIWV